MELEEKYKAIFAYLRRCECGCLFNQDTATKLQEFIDEEQPNYSKLPLKYQNKLDCLKKYHQLLLKDISGEEK